jgi:hypothetical protein
VVIPDESKLSAEFAAVPQGTIVVVESLRVPCCQNCRDHVATTRYSFGNAEIAVFQAIFITAFLAIGYWVTHFSWSLQDRRMWVTIAAALAFPIYQWANRGPLSRIKGRRLMTSNCVALGPPLTYSGGIITFLREEYADEFLSSNHKSAAKI